MTKKDYILIAEVLNTLGQRAEAVQMTGLHRKTCEEMSEKLQADNTRFDSIRFLEACGVK